MLKYQIKCGIFLLLLCLYFPSQGQNKIHIVSNDSLTTISFESESIDTILYFIIPENQANYSLIYQNLSDTQYIYITQDFFYFRDLKGVKIRFICNCITTNLQLSIRHVFPANNHEISTVFGPAYQSLFENYREELFFKNPKISYLIVCYKDFFPLINDFILSKEKENIDVYTIKVNKNETTDSIYKKIKLFYELYQPSYLLLIGDDEHVPSYRFKEGLSDIPYTLLKGSDDFPEMIVGRLSVECNDNLQHQINKILTRDNLLFSKRAVGIASNSVSSISGKQDWEYMRNIRNCLLNKGYATVDELYDGSQNGADKIGNPSEIDIINLINNGVSIINYLGYGSYYQWGTGNFTIESIKKIENTNEYPIIISAACLNGHFANKECFAEKWMNTSQQGKANGAIACLMFSSLIDWDAAIYGQQIFNTLLPHTDSTIQIGILYLKTYLKMIRFLNRSIDAKTWVLFGDPSMNIYPNNKTNLTNYHREDTITIYPNPFQTYFYIDNKQYNIKNIQLFNMIGKEISTKIIFDKLIIIQTKHLTKGFYILKISSENKTFYKKLIKN